MLVAGSQYYKHFFITWTIYLACHVSYSSKGLGTDIPLLLRMRCRFFNVKKKAGKKWFWEILSSLCWSKDLNFGLKWCLSHGPHAYIKNIWEKKVVHARKPTRSSLSLQFALLLQLFTLTRPFVDDSSEWHRTRVNPTQLRSNSTCSPHEITRPFKRKRRFSVMLYRARKNSSTVWCTKSKEPISSVLSIMPC